MTKKGKKKKNGIEGVNRSDSRRKAEFVFSQKGAFFFFFGRGVAEFAFFSRRLQAAKTNASGRAPPPLPGTRVPPLLTEYMALTMRDAVDTLPESSSKLCVSLFIVSTLMSGLPRVTPRRPGSENMGEGGAFVQV